jgi:pyruvate carboxylase subunit B
MIGPWKKMADGYGRMVLGYFGKTPLDPDPEIVKIAAEQLGLEPTTKTPLEINDANPNKGIEAARKKLQKEGLPETDENLFIVAACEDKGITFLKGEAKVSVRKISKKATGDAPSGYTVVVNGKEYSVVLNGGEATVNGKKYSVDVQEGVRETRKMSAEPIKGAPEESVSVKAPLPGVVVRIIAGEGDAINDGDTILVMEAMKMETEIKSPATGTIASITVGVGEKVQAGHILALIH